MRIRNKTMDRPNKIARSGTRFSVIREQGDLDIFKTAMIYTPSESFFVYTLPASMTLISKQRSFGHSLTGSGEGSSLIAASVAPYQPLTAHDMECQIAIYTPDLISLDSSDLAPKLLVPIFGIENQWIVVTYGSAQINVSYTAPDGDKVDINFFGNKFGLKFRVARNNDGYFNIGVFNNGWNQLNRKPIKFPAASEINLVEFEFSGKSTAEGNGSFEIQSYTSYPVILSDNWDDLNVTRMPMCISYTNTEAVFDSHPISYGIQSAYIQGYTSTSPFTVSSPSEGLLGDLDLVFDLERKQNPYLMTSQIKTLYSNSESRVCPVYGEKSNEIDVILQNRCFEDGSSADELSKTISLSTKNVGNLDSTLNPAKVVLQKDGYTFGRDLDLRQIQLFDEKASLSSHFQQADVIELASTEAANINVARCKVLSNDNRIYYGMYTPTSATNDSYPLKISLNLGIKYLQSEQASIPNEIIDGTKFNLKLNWMEEDFNFSTETLNVSTDYDLVYNVPNGHYSISIVPGVELATIDKSLFGLYGNIEIQSYDPYTGDYSTILAYNVQEPQISFGGAFQIRFDLKPYHGYGWFYIYDQANRKLLRNTLNGPTAIFECSATTDSISCVETPDGFMMIFIPIKTSFQGSEIELPQYFHGISNTVKYIKYDLNGSELNRGEIQLDNEVYGNSYVHAFDAVDANNSVVISYSLRNDRLQLRSSSVNIADKTYTHPRICSTSFPYIQPSVYTKTMAFDLHDFNQNETAPANKSETPLQSLNFILSSYRVSSGAVDVKGAVTIGDDYIPNHRTGPGFIRLSYDKQLNRSVLSVIDFSFRLPLIFSGNANLFREIAVPPFFAIQSQIKTGTSPLASIDACYGIDGHIWSTASTLSLMDVAGSSSSGRDMKPRFELMPLSTEILESNEVTFLRKSVGDKWYSWSNLKAYKPSINFMPMPILNQSDDVITSSIGEHSLNPNADSSLTFVSTSKLMPRELRNESISISSDKQFLILGQGGNLSKPANYFHINNFDRLGFNVPCDRHYGPESAYYTTYGNFLPGRLNITDAVLPSKFMNYIYLDFTNEARLEYSLYQTSNSTRARFSSLQSGSRHKLVFTADELDEEGVSVFIVDSYSDPTDLASPPTAVLASVRVDLYKIGNDLYYSSYTDSGIFGQDTIDLTEGSVFELHCCMIKSGVATYDATTILKRARGLDESFVNEGSSYLSGAAPYSNQDNYSKHYYTTIFKHDRTNEQSATSVTDPVQLFSINSVAGSNPDCAMKVLYYQVGILKHDGLLSESSLLPGYAYIENQQEIQAGERPIRSDFDIFDKSLDKTEGMPVYTGNSSSKELYLTSGYSAKLIGSYLPNNTFSLARNKINAADSAKATDVQGRWISDGTDGAVYLWSDSKDSNMDKFICNHVSISGANFSQFYIVVKDSQEEDWKRVKYFDTRSNGYKRLSTTGRDLSLLRAELAKRERSYKIVEVQNSSDLIADRLSEFSENPISRGLDVYLNANSLSSAIFYAEGITPYVSISKQRARHDKLNKTMEIVSISDDKFAVAANLDDSEDEIISIFTEDFHSRFQEVSSRFIGIEIPNQETYEGYYTLNVLDIGKSTQIGINFTNGDSSGISYDYKIKPQYMIDNVGVDGSFRLVLKTYNLEYQASEKLDYIKLKSIVDRISMSNKPLWLFETDCLSGILCFADDSPEYKILLDHNDKKIYSIKLNLTVVR